MGEIVAVQYIKAADLPVGMRIEKNLPKTGFIKKVVKFGSFVTEHDPVADPAEDILQSLSKLEVDFSSLKIGDLSDLKK